MTASPSVSFIKETLSEDIILTTNSTGLKQVLVNFENNPFKFTTSGYTKLGVKYNKNKGEICLYVEDTGIGIPVEEQKMIFDHFYKRDKFAQGTGLGFSICQVIEEESKRKIVFRLLEEGIR